MFTRSISVPTFVFKLLYINKVPLKFRLSACEILSIKYLPHTSYSLQLYRFFITSKPDQNIHTTKGWKTLARDGFKEENNTEKKFSSIEEGTDAVPHDVLMKQLQECNSVSDQFKTFCSSISLSPKETENRIEFCESLTEIFKPFFSKFRLHLFGSSINGLGFKGCDADVSIQTVFSGDEYVRNVKEVPTLESVKNGEVSTDTIAHLTPVSLLRYVRRILREHCPDVPRPILLIKARCPLLRFYSAKYDVFCDFSCENYIPDYQNAKAALSVSASLRNTKLTYFLCHLDERFSSLTKIIRYWGKHGGFVGDIDLFNSYSFTLLVVHFLQLRNPPVLPPIKEIIEKSEYVTNGDLYDYQLMLNDLKKFRPSQNSQTVEELLREYFFHYLTFDYSQMMLPVSSSFMPKTEFVPEIVEGSEIFEFSTVTVQDPFRLNFNTTAAAKFKTCKRFRSALIEACKAYQDENIWTPSANEWGLCSLFQKIAPDPEMSQRWETNNVYTIKLPLETDVTLLTKVFKEALLFHCQDLLIDDREKVSQPCLKFFCKVYHKTWIGRDWIYANHPKRLSDPLEIENWVSNQILTNNKEYGKQLLLTFTCECIKNVSDNELSVNLTFKESKVPLVLATFLKEYVPSLFKKLPSKN